MVSDMARRRKSSNRSDARITVCLPVELGDKVKRAAEAADDKPSTWIRKLIKQALGLTAQAA